MNLVNEIYNSISEADKPREIKSWHCSSIAQCPRAQYMMRLGIPAYSKPTGAKILRWGVGHKIEAELRPHLVKAYPKLQSNKRMYSKIYDLTGEFDNFDPETKTLIEIKSVAPYAVKHLKKDLKPYLAHEWQQHAYVLLLGEVERIAYVYASLDGFLMEFWTPVSTELLAQVKVRLIDLNEAWLTKEPPPCVCQPSNPLWGSILQYCPYREADQCCRIK